MTSGKCKECNTPLRGKRQIDFCSATCGVVHGAKRNAEACRIGVSPPPVYSARWIPLGHDRWVLVDASQYKRFSKHYWCFSDGYAIRWEGRRKIYLHAELVTAYRVDHKNGNTLDCRLHNLRPATQAQNSMNMKKPRGAFSSFKGVCWHKQRRRWRAYIRQESHQKHLGLFNIEEEAALAYDTAARIRFGEFARLNFPRPGEQSALTSR